ncbi:MAG: NirD/YgiW/YdeI family stress tolerance protein [Alphaproteobacteria bacterium]|nr:NirD/YgiW/YdeI family stress tolerance protein [Alphaproteobacteria bacterium]
MHNLLKITTSTIAVTLMTGVAAYAASGSVTTKTNMNAKTTTPAAEAVEGTENGSVKFKNDTYITLSGTVGEITDNDEFKLKHPGGTIMVDTNDTWPDLFRKDADTIIKMGDRVTVTGKVDNNLFAANEIEAYQLTVDGSGYNRVYTNNNFGPENDDSYMASYGTYGSGLTDDQDVRLSGVVSSISDNEAFMLRYGNGEIRIETDDVEFTNANRLAVGDEVVVFGEVDEGWFKKKAIEADRIILSRAYSQITR